MKFGVEKISGEWRVGPVAEDGTLTKMLATRFKDREAAEDNAKTHNNTIRRHREEGGIPCWSFEKRGRD